MTTLYEPPDNTAFKDRALYIVNTDQGSVVEVTIDAHGDPGTPSVFATGIFSPDGITLGPWRDLYVSDAFTGRVIRIASDGTTEVAASSGFAEPANTSLVFGAGAEKTRSTSRTSASPSRVSSR